MKEVLLQINDLHIGYKMKSQTYLIQENLNINVKGGELICLIGPNGVGKSTLLKTIGRILPDLGGDILISNQNLKSLSQNYFSRQIGIVLTDHVDVPLMKAVDIIAMGRFPYTGFWGKLKNEDWDIVYDVATKVGLTYLLSRPFAELSDGEKQKVMIAKVLAQRTPLMLLDEPTAFLDFPTKSSLLILLRKLAREQNMGVVLSTHDIELALKTADQIWMFPEHKRMISGAPEDLVLQGAINEVFQNEVISFNRETGHFEKAFVPKKTAYVKGKGEKVFWLKKALTRNEILFQENADCMIVCKEKFEVYQKQSLVAKVDCIEEVLELITEAY